MSTVVVVDTDVVSFLFKGDTRAHVTHNRDDFADIADLIVISEE